MKDYNVIIENLTEGIITNLEEAYDYGYKQGYEDGRNNTEYMVSSAYKHGMEESWEAARKLMISSSEGGLEPDIIAEIFDGLSYYMVLKDVSASEAVAKIKEYEEQQKQDAIKVWDEVYSEMNDLRFIVTRIITSKHMDITVKRYEGICTDGACYDNLPEDIVKTGRTFPQISEVLEKMRGESE